MPIITIQAIEGVVLTSPELKRELLKKMTDTFISVVGEVARPYTYCLIQETPLMEWSIAGVPLPDLPFLYGPEYAAMHAKANGIMRDFVESQSAAPDAHADEHDKQSKASSQWEGELNRMSTAEEHQKLFARWFEQLWNQKNYAITKELVDPGFTAHGAGGQDIKQGPDGVAGMVSVWHAAFPDGHMSLDDLITEGEYSVIRMTFTGTHKGDFYGVPASGKSVKVTSIGIDRVVGGKITEGWGELDMLGMMQQIGAIPTPGASGGAHEIEADISPEHVSEAYAALASGDMNRIKRYWAEDMVWQVPGHNGLSGWYSGLNEFLAFMGEVGKLSGGSFRMDQIAGKVLVTGQYSVDLTRNRGNRAGEPDKTMDIEVAHVLRWRDGKVIAGKGAIFGDGTEEYNQFWSRSPAVTPPTH